MVVHLEGRGGEGRGGEGRGGEIISERGERGRKREEKAEGGGKCRHTHTQPLTEYCMQFALGPVRCTYLLSGHPRGVHNGWTHGVHHLVLGRLQRRRKGWGQTILSSTCLYVCMYM